MAGRRKKRVEEEQRASGMIEFPFRMTDITVMGYDLSEDHFADLEALCPVEESSVQDTYWNGHGTAAYGEWKYGIHIEYIGTDEEKELWFDYMYKSGWEYEAYYHEDGWCSQVQLMLHNYNNGECVFDDAVIHVPVKVGEAAEDWYRVMQIDRIKENNLRPEERDGMVGIWDENGYGIHTTGKQEGSEYWLFSTEGCQGLYSEYDMGRVCELQFYITDYRLEEEWPIDSIRAEIRDGVIMNVSYVHY